jgi:glycosyltransferase involved in cell wall biosynthesis
MEAIEQVRQQTYRPLEHVIVSDGPDPELRAIIAMIQREAGPSDPPITFAELGRNTTTALTDSYSAVPFGVAQWMARGAYVAWLSDDERWTDPDALTIMVDALDAAVADYVYPKARVWWKGQPERSWIIGEPEPRFATITHVVHRWDILDVPGGGFRTHVGRANDWDQIARWMAAGKRHAFVDRVLIEHRMDQGR